MWSFGGGDPDFKPYETENRAQYKNHAAPAAKQSSHTASTSHQKPSLSSQGASPSTTTHHRRESSPGKGVGTFRGNNIGLSENQGMRRIGAITAGLATGSVLALTKDRLSVGASEHNVRTGGIPRPICTDTLAKLLESRYKYQHHALFRTPINNFPKSPSEQRAEFGNSDYVKLPFGSLNTTHKGGGTSKWEVITEELTKLMSLCETGGKDIAVGHSLANSIKRYNDSSKGYNFRILDHPHISQRLRQILPTIVEYAIQLEYLLGEPIPFLKEGRPNTIYVTRRLACSLLAHCFLCTIPHEGRPPDMPYFHFLNLFHEDYDAHSRTEGKLEKIKCILEYFNQMANISGEEGNRIISFERRCIYERQDWARSEAKLCDYSVNSKDGIESADGMLQVDFANKRVGGGILSDGMVMEEIRFAICPELILSRLFTETLGDDEVLIVTGTKQFTTYTGYGPTFRFQGGKNTTPSEKDSLGREYAQVVAMDALQFSKHQESTQYEKLNIDRELNKCFVGFSHFGKHISPVATGNWGCGVFNGDKELKILLQWMAASMVGRPRIVFYTGSMEQSRDIEELGLVLKIRNVRVGDLYKILMKYQSSGKDNKYNRYLSVFQFIRQKI